MFNIKSQSAETILNVGSDIKVDEQHIHEEEIKILKKRIELLENKLKKSK